MSGEDPMEERGSIICKLKVRNVLPPQAYDTHGPGFESFVACSSSSASSSGDRRYASMTTGAKGHLPEKCDKLCHWCIHEFESRPVGMPVRKRSDGVFESEGVYCSMECVAAHVFDRFGSSCTAMDRYTLCREWTGLDKRVDPAPARELLTTFGGPLGIDEFRNASGPDMRTKTVAHPVPMISRARHVEEVALGTQRGAPDTSRYVPIDDATASASSSFAGLRRPTTSTRKPQTTVDLMCQASSS